MRRPSPSCWSGSREKTGAAPWGSCSPTIMPRSLAGSRPSSRTLRPRSGSRRGAYRNWLKMPEPHWANVRYGPIDYQAISYYAAPKAKPKLESLAQVDPKLVETFAKLGIPIEEQKRLAGVAVDAVFDSVSVATTFRETLARQGIIFCAISEAIREHPELVRAYLGAVVPHNDNFFAALNSAVFTDGSFAYIPKGVRCPLELSTYFRINTSSTGQFERTLIVAEEASSVSYLEG